jgi:hypothetical protein
LWGDVVLFRDHGEPLGRILGNGIGPAMLAYDPASEQLFIGGPNAEVRRVELGHDRLLDLGRAALQER